MPISPSDVFLKPKLSPSPTQMTFTHSKTIDEIDSELAEKLFEEQAREGRIVADRLFVKLLIIQWVGGVLAVFVASLIRNGSEGSDYSHAWSAVLIGGVITAIPLVLLIKNPGAKQNGYIVGACQMLISGLLIHLTGGRIESHFHIFASLAFLSFYRDWKVLVPATLVTTADHVIRGSFFPLSMYGIFTGAEWRWVEHAFWIVFATSFLFVVCRRNTTEMRGHALRAARLDSREARFRAVLEQTSEAIFLLDTESLKVTEYNTGLSRMLGYDHDDSEMPRKLRDFTRIKDERLESIVTALNEQKRIQGETLFVDKEGKEFPVELRMAMVNFGNKLAVSASATDITFRKEGEKRLQEINEELEQRVEIRTEELKLAKQFYSSVIEHLPLGVFVKDDELFYVIANKIIKERVEFDGPTMAGMRDRDFPKKFKDYEGIENDERQLLASNEPIVIPEYKYTDENGRTRYCEIRKEPLVINDGKSHCILGIVHDYTERKEIEIQLRQAQKLESIGQLAAGIAHEINTPTQFVGDNLRFVDECFEDLNGLIGMFEKLIDDSVVESEREELIKKIRDEIETIDLEYLQEEIPQALSQSHEGIERIARIVESMRDFSHPGNDVISTVDLNKAIVSTVTVAKNQWKYVADLETDLDKDLPLVPCLVGEFNQVVLNMILNATHAIEDVVGENSTEKGTIRVSTSLVDEEWVKISITDSGSGIPPEVQSKIFDPFFTTKEVGKGTGQGLAISHNVIVEKHQGRIEVESEVGKGSNFTIHLPLTTNRPQPEEA